MARKKSTSDKVDPEAKLSVAKNKRARFDYEILETLEAGLVLTGSEVKSLRTGQVTLAGSFVRERGQELWLESCDIPRYEHASTHLPHEPLRSRKLLIRRAEFNRLLKSVSQKGLALIPLHLYFVRGFAKVEVGLGRGKKAHDKRDSIKKREMDRQMNRLNRRRR